MKSTQKKKEMYMANARILRLGPNATYIPLTRVGVSHWGNANLEISRWWSKPTRGFNPNVFALQWNIGLRSNIVV